ncbi:hypothetical protein LZG04_11235 [Saccharothrix sp. S26]|nr:hypothetical protein [Saccharothrix sp. S26]
MNSGVPRPAAAPATASGSVEIVACDLAKRFDAFDLSFLPVDLIDEQLVHDPRRPKTQAATPTPALNRMG